MTLQEQIARRLTEFGAHPLSDIAAEVERWMEWARRECAPPDYTDADGYACTSPLTLPPEDWKP